MHSIFTALPTFSRTFSSSSTSFGGTLIVVGSGAVAGQMNSLSLKCVESFSSLFFSVTSMLPSSSVGNAPPG